MPSREKELVAIAISVAAGCKPCTDHHVKVDEIRQAMVDAIDVRRRTADIRETYALAHLSDDPDVPSVVVSVEMPRVALLIRVGAAFAVNCVSSLEQYLTAAKDAGVSDDEISEIARLAVFIKKKAASHVEHLVGLPEDKAA